VANLCGKGTPHPHSKLISTPIKMVHFRTVSETETIPSATSVSDYRGYGWAVPSEQPARKSA